MTLRFFRRKSGAARSEAKESAAAKDGKEPEVETTRRTSRRRTRKTTSKDSDEKKPAAPSTETKTTTSRTRRGRRGGVGRKKKTPAAATSANNETPAAEVAEPVAIPEGASLEDLMVRQLEALRSVQGSLSAIENRLTTVGTAVERPRLGIFVDVPNVMYAAERLKVKLDYAKMLEFLTRGRELVRASAYAPISDDPGERFDSQRFVQPFANLGYRLVTKPHKRYADGSMKANFDVELAIDVVAMSDRLDVVTLVSGDGDFRRLVELVASKGVRVEVVAFSGSTAQELRAVADQYIDLNECLEELKP